MQGLDYTIKAGDLDIFKFQELYVESSRYRPIVLAGIVLSDPDREITKSLSEGDSVTLEFGYQDKEKVSFDGELTRIKPTSKLDEIEICAAAGLELINKVITESYENETAQAILKYALSQTGLKTGTIEDPGVIFKNFAADSINAWQIAQQCLNTCEKSFNLGMEGWALWLNQNNEVNFSGDFDDSGTEISFDEQLIRHKINSGYGRHNIETLLIPTIFSSMKFSLNDSFREIERDCNAIDVRHEIVGEKARTYIDYKVVE